MNLLQQPTDASVQPDVRWSVEPEMILFVAAAVLTVIVAVVVIGPKDLPLALRTAGRWIGKVRRVSGHFRAGVRDGCCGAAIPYVPYNIGVLVLCLNIFLPGIGTFVSAYYDPSGCNCKAITCGVF